MANIPFLNNAYFSAKVGIGTDSPDADFVVSHQGTSGIEIEANFQMGVNNILSFDRTAGALAYETMRLSANDFWFTALGVERMRITSTGNVGIGTDSPVAKLHIADTNKALNSEGNLFVATTDAVAIDKGGQISLGGVWYNTTSTIEFAAIAGRKANSTNGNAGGYLQLSTSLSAGGTMTEKMRITQDGKVGIGTTDPGLKLDINSGTANSALRVLSTDRYTGIKFEDDTNNDTLFYDGQSDLMYLGSTNFRAVDLHATGNLRVEGAIYDSNNSPGTANQVLISTVTGTDWVDGSGSSIIGGPYLPLAGGTMTGTNGVIFPDNFNLKIGTGSDLQIYHSGTESKINNDVGNLSITNFANDSDIIFQSDDGSGGTATYFYLDGSLKLNRFLTHTLYNDNVEARFGTSTDLKIYHDGINSYVNDTGTGALVIRGSILRLQSNGAESMITASANASVQLFYNNVEKFATTSTGVSVTGNGIFTGNVGIGTTSPGAKLDVSDSIPVLRITGTRNANWTIDQTMASLEYFSEDASGSSADSVRASINLVNEISVYGSTTGLSFSTKGDVAGSPIEAMRINSSGNVGIGTTAPTSLLEISQQLSAASTIDYPYTISSRDDANSINQAGGEGVGIKFRIAGNATTTPGDSLVGASIAAIRESSSDTNSSTGLGFFVTQNDETLDEALRIGNDRNIQFNAYGAGTLVSDASGNITVSSGGGAGGPYLPLAGGTMAGTITMNNNRITSIEELRFNNGGNIGNQINTDVDTGTETVANVEIATYTAAFFDFAIKKTTNVRSGTVYACHDGTNVEFTETSTNDLGDTSDVTLSVDISGTNMRLLATVTSDDWSVKSLIRAI